MTKTASSPPTDRTDGSVPDARANDLIGRISRLELVIGATIAALMVALVLIEPDVLEAPFQNGRTLAFTLGGTVLAAIALIAMLWLGVHPVVRVIVLVVPFAVVNWWLISPYFVDEVVDEGFATSISEQISEPAVSIGDAPLTVADGAPIVTVAPRAGDLAAGEQGIEEPADAATDPAVDAGDAGDAVAPTQPATEAADATAPGAADAPSGPVLLGAGRFVGLAGHDGTGDAGVFRNPDGSLVLRFENFDIENGPDLEVYLVPGTDQVSLADGSIHLGALKGNVGDQNYDLPAGTQLAPGAYTALVWCEAFGVEFVGATIVL